MQPSLTHAPLTSCCPPPTPPPITPSLQVMEACTKGDDSADVSTIIKQEIKGNNPWISAMSEALTEAQACGCKPADCYWCDSGYAKRR